MSKVVYFHQVASSNSTGASTTDSTGKAAQPSIKSDSPASVEDLQSQEKKSKLDISHSKVVYLCKFCSMSYSDPGTLQKHVVCSHQDRFSEYCKETTQQSEFLNSRFICRLCLLSFTLSDDLLAHIQIEHLSHSDTEALTTHSRSADKKDESRVKCEKCSETFASRNSMLNHMNRKHTFEEPAVCSKCGKTYRNKARLTDHIRKMHRKNDKAQLQCPHCDKKFSANSHQSLKYHLLIKHNDGEPNKDSYCDICDKAFTCKAALLQHQATHSGEKRFTCEVCGKMIGSKASLKLHVKNKHESPGRHTCVFCGKVFGWQQSLKLHLEAFHLGRKQYTCEFCQKVFDRQSNLKEHVETVHLKIARFQCKICLAGFKRRPMVLNHITTVHGVPPESNNFVEVEARIIDVYDTSNSAIAEAPETSSTSADVS